MKQVKMFLVRLAIVVVCAVTPYWLGRAWGYAPIAKWVFYRGSYNQITIGFFDYSLYGIWCTMFIGGAAIGLTAIAVGIIVFTFDFLFFNGKLFNKFEKKIK